MLNHLECFARNLNLVYQKTQRDNRVGKDCEVGEKFSKYLNDEDIEIEIAITPNRVDCAGVFGIARDLNAAGFGKLKPKRINKIKDDFKSTIKLENLKNSSCPQFLLREIRDVKNLKSPKKL